MAENDYMLEPIGAIRSELTNLADAPRQGDEGSYEAWLEFTPQVASGLVGISVGDRLVILTWLHLAQRDTLQVHPRDDMTRPLTGVFATRSSDRPNPIGLHAVTVMEIDGLRLKVAPLEAIDSTPIVDVKPVLTRVNTR
jgi:tRNA-Thr(GGU) m(6)t(6)A37 methyltransferase TsaA